MTLTPEQYAEVLERAANSLDENGYQCSFVKNCDSACVRSCQSDTLCDADAAQLRALAKAMREATPMWQATLQDLLSDRILITLPEAP